MVTKKQRRRQMTQARVVRRATRAQQREHRRRLTQIIVAGLLVAVAVVALVAWIVMHDPDSGTSPSARGDYDAASVDRTRPLNIEVTGE